MGKTGQVDDPDVQAAISHVRTQAESAGISLGIFGATVEAVRLSIRIGFTLVAIGLDVVLPSDAARKITDAFLPP
jgi:2-keto-3-deoxy-L-rhamnonate aldolase RhmA